MTRTQERAVAAMRAIGDTVTGAPPLHLPPQAAAASSPRPARSLRQAWRLWLVPAAAAIAVVAVAVSLVLVRSVPKESAASAGATGPAASSSSPAAAAVGPDGVPQYYVALPVFGWYAYAPATGSAGSPGAGGLVVGSTVTGKQLAIVTPPDGLTFNFVTAAADDRTFVVGAASGAPLALTTRANWSESWYLLRISPGKAHVAQLTKLPVPAVSNVTGAAISPDGTELAVSYQQSPGTSGAPATGSPELTLWSVATGQALRHWGTGKGQITASAPIAKYVSDALDSAALGSALRWTPDGRELAFAWNGSAIRLLNLASQASSQGDLITASTLRAAIGTTYTGVGAAYTCDEANGWSLSAGAATLTCAGTFTPADNEIVPSPGDTPPTTGAVCGRATPAHPAFIQQTALSGGGTLTSVLAQSPVCTSAAPRIEDAALGWASSDGSKVIGALNADFPGSEQYGIYTSKTFTKLLGAVPALSSVAW